MGLFTGKAEDQNLGKKLSSFLTRNTLSLVQPVLADGFAYAYFTRYSQGYFAEAATSQKAWARYMLGILCELSQANTFDAIFNWDIEALVDQRDPTQSYLDETALCQ